MSRLKALLAKIDGKDATDATPYLISNARENVRHYIGEKYGIRWNLASIASMASFPTLASVDVLWRTPKYDDPTVMAKTLLENMRAIGVTVSMTPDGRLSLTPENILWVYDKTLIAELEPQLKALLERESNRRFQI